MITARELRNIIAVIHSIDRHEIEEAGYDISDLAWEKFRNDPCRQFLKHTDGSREAIMRVIEARTMRAA